MVDSYILAVLMGILLGFLSGLGTGGGSLLILWLTLVLGTPQPEAKAINLLFFIPSALIACLFRWKQGRLDVKKLLPAIIAGSVTATVFACCSAGWDTALLRKLFGILLLITGTRELLYQPKER